MESCKTHIIKGKKMLWKVEKANYGKYKWKENYGKR